MPLVKIFCRSNLKDCARLFGLSVRSSCAADGSMLVLAWRAFASGVHMRVAARRHPPCLVANSRLRERSKQRPRAAWTLPHREVAAAELHKALVPIWGVEGTPGVLKAGASVGARSKRCGSVSYYLGCARALILIIAERQQWLIVCDLRCS